MAGCGAVAGPPTPPTASTLPFDGSVAVWQTRGPGMERAAVHALLAGSYSSAVPAALPPTTSTLPSCKAVAACNHLAEPIGAAGRQLSEVGSSISAPPMALPLVPPASPGVVRSVAMVGSPTAQAAVLVKSREAPSVPAPVAVNWTPMPASAGEGPTVRDTSVGCPAAAPSPAPPPPRANSRTHSESVHTTCRRCPAPAWRNASVHFLSMSSRLRLDSGIHGMPRHAAAGPGGVACRHRIDPAQTICLASRRSTRFAPPAPALPGAAHAQVEPLAADSLAMRHRQKTGQAEPAVGCADHATAAQPGRRRAGLGGDSLAPLP